MSNIDLIVYIVSIIIAFIFGYLIGVNGYAVKSEKVKLKSKDKHGN